MGLLLLALATAPRPGLPPAGSAWVRAGTDGAGGGFVVDVSKRLLVTCRHVVADRTSVEVFFPWVNDGALVTGRAEYLRRRTELRARGLLVAGKVLRTSDAFDLALVELDSLPPGAKAVTLSARTPHPGEALRVVGHRTDLDTLWNVTRGPLRATGPLADGYFWRGKKLAAGANALIAQFPTEVGDSGGPVFDARGEVVGVDSALRRACPLAAVAVSANDIRTFLNAPAKPTGRAEPGAAAERLVGATVWVRPTATDAHRAGALIDADLVLTAARGLTPADCVGVALPVKDGGGWLSERAVYADPVGLHLRGAWRTGRVLACDPHRDLALVKLDRPAEHLRPLPLAARVPHAGDELHAVSHPGGLEFAWVYASGSVRQRGRVVLGPGDGAPRVDALVCQLPVQAGSPGGPVANATGALVGLLSSREGAQQVGYAVTADEIRRFLDAARRDRPPTTLPGLVARFAAVPEEWAASAARALGRRAEEHRVAGRLAEARRDADAAVSLHPGCPEARLCRAALDPDAARAELDAAVEYGPFHRDVLTRRAALALAAKDFRTARGDAARVLDALPADADARELLACAHLELGEDAKAAAALGALVRADPKRLKAAAGVILDHADALGAKFPDSPGAAADWFATAVGGVRKGTRDPSLRASLGKLLDDAGAAKDDAARLGRFRAAVREWR